MGNEVVFGVRIKGENREAVEVVRETRTELEQLGNTNAQVSEKIRAQNASFTATSAELKKTAAAQRLSSDESLRLDAAITRLRSSIDPAFASMRQLDQANDLLHRGMREGVITQSEYQSALGLVKTKFGEATSAAGENAFATAGARRELIVLGHEAISGNFSRIPGSFMVLAERMGGVTSMINPMTLGIAGVGAAVVAGAYAWTQWGDHANAATQRVIDGIDKSKKSLEEFQKEFDKLERVDLAANTDSLELQKEMLLKRQRELLDKDGGLKGTLNIFNPLGPKKEYDDLAEKISFIDRQIGLANNSMRKLADDGGKDFRSFMENTSYMDKTHQKLHDLTEAAKQYRDAWMGASDDVQRQAALDRFQEAQKAIDDRYKDKKTAQGPHLYAQEMRDLAALMQDIDKLDESEKTHIQVLQDKLDAYGRIDPAVKQYLQGLLEQAKAAEQAANWDRVMAESIDRQIETDNAIEAVDKAAAEARDATYSDLSKRLQEENENLNVGLIASDRQRAKAQIDLEHQRALDRINGLMLESDQAQELIEQETKNYELRVKQVDASLSKTKDVARELGLTFQSAFEDGIINGKKFSDVLLGIGQDIERLAIRKTMTEPLMKGISSWMDSMDVGSWFSGLFNANGNAFTSGGMHAFANGGAFGDGAVLTQPTFFRFASGGSFASGVAGEAGPEGALPLKRMSNGKLGVYADGGGGMNVTVNLIESPGNGGKVEQRADGSGGMTIDIMVEQIEARMSRNINRGGGIAPTLENRYGLNSAARSI